MRYFEISAGYRIMCSLDEKRVLDDVRKAGSVEKLSLDDRDQEVARNLVNKGLLLRSRRDGKIVFEFDDVNRLWRI